MRYLVKWPIRDPIDKYHIELHVLPLQIDMKIAKKGDGELDTVLIPTPSSFCIPKCIQSHPKAPPSCPNGPNSDPKDLPKSTQNLTTSLPAANAGAQGVKPMPKATKMVPEASKMELTDLPNDTFGHQK